MNISYENKMNLAFDKPLEYKSLLLYPATLPYYSIFASADECLDVSRLDEKNVRLLRLPYLEYLYEKSLIDESFKNKWNMLICILNIVLKEDQPFDILRQEGKLYIKVYQRSENYELLNKEYTILRTNFLAQHKEQKASKQELETIAKKLSDIQDKMYVNIMIGSEEFEEMRQLIMMQNDIKSQHYDAQTEKFLYEMKQKLQQTRAGNDNTDLEDLITVVSYSMNINPLEMENMTIRRFNRYLHIVVSKDDYYMYKQLELSGMIKMKSDLPHWINHYEPKGKFDDILVDSKGLMSSLQDGDKI
mgnify:FL=1